MMMQTAVLHKTTSCDTDGTPGGVRKRKRVRMGFKGTRITSPAVIMRWTVRLSAEGFGLTYGPLGLRSFSLISPIPWILAHTFGLAPGNVEMFKAAGTSFYGCPYGEPMGCCSEHWKRFVSQKLIARARVPVRT